MDEKYDAAAVRPLLVITSRGLRQRLALAACGSEGITVSEDDAHYRGAELFAERCSGCHTLDAAGARGSANRVLRNQGPNLDERVESDEDVLYAIRNGGFSGRDHAPEHRRRRGRPGGRRRSSPSTRAARSTGPSGPSSQSGPGDRRAPRRPMLDLKRIREDPGRGARRRSRGAARPTALDELLELDARRRELLPAGRGGPRAPQHGLRRDRGGEARRRGCRGARSRRCASSAARSSALEEELAEVEARRDELAATLPNLPHPDAPDGGEDDARRPSARSASAPSFGFEVRDHLDLGTAHGWIEMEKAAEASGSRFAYLLGDLVLVELALIRFAVESRSAPRASSRSSRPSWSARARSTAPGSSPASAR